MPSREVPVPDSITQLQQRFEQFRTTRTRRTKLPEALWQAAVEQAREHGVNVVAQALRLDYSGLKKRLSGTSVPRGQVTPAAFVELVGASGTQANEYIIEFESNPSPRMRVQCKGAAPPDWTALLRAWREVAG
jgi:hypothetical protein